MAVFPESMSRVDPNEPREAVAIIESYIRYMQERIEFANSQTTRTVTEAGVSSAGLYLEVQTLANTVQALSSSLTAALTTLASHGQRMGALENGLEDERTARETQDAALLAAITAEEEARASAIAALDTTVAALAARMDAVESRATEESAAREAADAAINASIAALESRVAALEASDETQ